MPMFNKQQPMN